MGTWLIFQGLAEVTKAEVVYVLIGLAVQWRPSRKQPCHYRPYPKPTQVDR